MNIECIVQVAILIRCMSAHYFGAHSPFDIVPDGVKPALVFLRIPADLTNLTDATPFIDAEVSQHHIPTLIYIYPTSDYFKDVRGLVVYTNGEQDANSREVKKIGYQIKTGDNQHVNVIYAAVLDHTYLFRGRINSTVNTKLSTQNVGWTYLSVSEMKSWSLAAASSTTRHVSRTNIEEKAGECEQYCSFIEETV